MENVHEALKEFLPGCLARLVWEFARPLPEPFFPTFDRHAWYAESPEYDEEGVYGGYAYNLTTLPGLALYSW